MVESDDPFVELFKTSMCDLPSSDDIGTDELPPDLPPMRYDILGVDTQNIYTKVSLPFYGTNLCHITLNLSFHFKKA